MDKHTQTLRWTQMLQAKKKLEDHQFQVDLFPTQKECLEYLKGLLKDQVSVSVGGSMTLFETGIIDFLENNQPVSNTLIDKQAIPPHAGCYLGSLTKALADAIDQLGVQ